MKVCPDNIFCGRIADFLRNRAGSIAPIFAVAAIPLTIAVGSATDIGRTMDIRSQMQDMSDSAALAGATQFTATSDAAAVTKAVTFISAAIPSLPSAPTAQVTASCAAPVAGAVGVIVANVCDLGQSTSGTTVTAQIKVMLAGNIATTFSSLVVPKVAVSTQATAQANVGRNVVFTITNFNSSASDLDQIYYYSIPSGMSGTTLYQWVPTLTSGTLLLSNSAGFKNVNQTVQIPYGTTVGFAMANTTGGISSYGSNCYGQAVGTKYLYYSHREDSVGSYWDYNVPQFTACTSGSANYWTGTIVSNGVTELFPCNSSDAAYVRQIGTCNSSQTYAAGNYVYYTDSNTAYKPYDALYGTPYSKNPLKYGTTNTDCTQGTVTYEWDDNGGNPDDNDYNDAVFTVNCSTTSSLQSSIKLVS